MILNKNKLTLSNLKKTIENEFENLLTRNLPLKSGKGSESWRFLGSLGVRFSKMSGFDKNFWILLL